MTFHCSFLGFLNSIYCSRDFFHLSSLSCSHCWCYSAGFSQWRSSHRLTLERPSRVSTSPSIKPHSEWVWNTRARISRCLTCQWRPRRLTRTDGWPTISPGRPACPRTTWPGPCATSPTEKQLQKVELWWVTFKETLKLKIRSIKLRLFHNSNLKPREQHFEASHMLFQKVFCVKINHLQIQRQPLMYTSEWRQSQNALHRVQ